MSLEQSRRTEKPGRPRRVVLAGAAAFLSLVMSSFGYPAFLDSFSAVHHPHSGCSVVPVGAMYCQERTYDDGHVRVSLFSTAQRNCCRLLREPLDQYAMRSEQTYCGKEGAALSCGQFNGYDGSGGILIGNQVLKGSPQD